MGGGLDAYQATILSGIGPPWASNEFVQWPGYATLWRNALAWLTRAA